MYNVIRKRAQLAQGSGTPVSRAAPSVPVGTVDPSGIPALVAQELMARAGNDKLKFLALTSAMASPSAISNLPGATPQEKVKYYADYLDAGYKMGLTAWDMIQGRHDSNSLTGAMPRKTMGGAPITNPAEAAKYSFANVGSGSMELMRKAAADPNAYQKKLAQFQTTAAGKPAAPAATGAPAPAGATAPSTATSAPAPDPTIDQQVRAPQAALQKNANVVETLKNTAVAGAQNQPTAPAGSNVTNAPAPALPTPPAEPQNPTPRPTQTPAQEEQDPSGLRTYANNTGTGLAPRGAPRRIAR